MSAWIRMIPDDEADADLSDALAGARTPHGTVDNVLRVHSLRPNTSSAMINAPMIPVSACTSRLVGARSASTRRRRSTC